MKGLSRARFLAGAATLTAAGLNGSLAGAQGAAGNRIDVHRHPNPPFFTDAVQAAGRATSPTLRRSTAQTLLADMDAAGVATGILSIAPDPAIFFGDVEATRRLARACNEYMAELRRTYPGRYGIFAALPMPDVEGSLREIAYAFDQLKVEGIGLFTSYDRRYLGDASFDPLWAELNRRKAVVFTHPLANDCCQNLVPGVPPAIIEFGTDTTRTIASLVFSGTASRYPEVRVIFSHAGGTMPFLIERFNEQTRLPASAAMVPNGVEYVLKKFYYDTAQASNPEAMGALLRLVPSTQVLFGTDFPYRKGTDNVAGLAALNFDPPLAAAIDRGNALRLLGRS